MGKKGKKTGATPRAGEETKVVIPEEPEPVIEEVKKPEPVKVEPKKEEPKKVVPVVEPKVEKKAAAEPAKVVAEPVKEVEEEMPELEAQGDEQAHEFNRNEKKCRKALIKVGMKQLQGITRVTLKKRDGLIFVIDDPEVLNLDNSYAIFGELKLEDLNRQMQMEQAKKFAQQAP